MGLRRKKRSEKQRALLRIKQRSPIGIGRTRQQEKDAADRAEAQQSHETHDKVWARDSTCRICHGERCKVRWQDEMHEKPSRAQTRNLPPEQRCSTRICARVGRICHRMITDHEIDVEFLSDRGFDGPVMGVPT